MSRTLDRNVASDEEYTLEQAKTAYWNRVINGFDLDRGLQFKRLVGNADLIPSQGDRGWDQPVDIWLPQSVDEPFNLVLSLCDDGRHRPLVDHDLTIIVTGTFPSVERGRAVVVPSTYNFHVIWSVARSWEETLRMCGNDAYRDRSKLKGYTSLRPPWVTKDGWGVRVFDKSWFAGFIDNDFVQDVPVPVDDGLTGWDDLWGDDQ